MQLHRGPTSCRRGLLSEDNWRTAEGPANNCLEYLSAGGSTSNANEFSKLAVEFEPSFVSLANLFCGGALETFCFYHRIMPLLQLCAFAVTCIYWTSPIADYDLNFCKENCCVYDQRIERLKWIDFYLILLKLLRCSGTRGKPDNTSFSVPIS